MDYNKSGNSRAGDKKGPLINEEGAEINDAHQMAEILNCFLKMCL